MLKKLSLLSVSIVFLSFLADTDSGGRADKDFSKKAKKLADRFIIVDGHIDMPDHSNRLGIGIFDTDYSGQFDYEKAKRGGLDAPFMSIYVGSELGDDEAFSHANKLIDMVDELTMNHPEKFQLAYRVRDVRAQFEQGIISLPMGMENGSPLKEDLSLLDHFYSRGIRYITLCHNKSNKICDSSTDSDQPHGGLSEFGVSVVKKMNTLGIMVDVSHVSDETIEQVLLISDAPIIASHSSCKAITPGYPRNLSDSLIRRIAEKGGVVMINFGNMFVEKLASENMMKMKAEMDKRNMYYSDPEFKAFSKEFLVDHPMKAAVEDVVDHIDHIVQLVGVDYVGFGSDFDGVGPHVPEGLEDVSKYPALIAELMKRGYSDSFIEKICGENLLRVWEDVELIAAN